jgi:hypothetical protein
MGSVESKNGGRPVIIYQNTCLYKKAKAVPLHTMKALGERGYIAPTHSRPWH